MSALPLVQGVYKCVYVCVRECVNTEFFLHGYAFLLFITYFWGIILFALVA